MAIEGAPSVAHLEVQALRGDCARCAGLCCVAPAFSASSEFAVDKPAGRPCANLAADFRCTIHADLRERGFSGCSTFDCFGAGQRVTQHTFSGTDWAAQPAAGPAMFAAFGVVRALHELLRYVAEARDRAPTSDLRAEALASLDEIDRLAASDAEGLALVDLAEQRARVGALLGRTSERARAIGAPGKELRGADLVGTDLRRADLRRADLRGAVLLGAQLAGADLRGADLLGTDLRGAQLAGADLREALFLTQPQLDGARGDATTKLPQTVDRPTHWAAATSTI